jgi:ribokinase
MPPAAQSKSQEKWVTGLGSFVADLAFRAKKVPAWGETIMGSDFLLGPGGKGSNQAVAAARLGGKVGFISKLASDAFGELARRTFAQEKIDARFVFETTAYPTGAAVIIVDEVRGENAIVVVPGACYQVSAQEIDQAKPLLAQSAVLLTQLELQMPSVEYGLRLAHDLGVQTILNPAPGLPLPDSIFPLCDYLTPNETEAATITGLPVTGPAEAERAARLFLGKGVQNVILTLGAAGALVVNSELVKYVPAIDAGPVVETTGAGDAFNGGLAVALAEGRDIVTATQFGCAVAGISVTRRGTAPSMPTRLEVDALLARV